MSADSIRDAVRDTLDDVADAGGRSMRHILLGVAVTVGAVALSTVIAGRLAPPPEIPGARMDDDKPERPGPRRAVFAVVWPPLFLALTLSGLRIWNAPRSPARTQALTLWGMVQALNAIWMALGPKRLGGQLAAAVASIGTSVAYAFKARRVDGPAGDLAAPYLGWISLATAVTDEWRRKTAPKPTIH